MYIRERDCSIYRLTCRACIVHRAGRLSFVACVIELVRPCILDLVRRAGRLSFVACIIELVRPCILDLVCPCIIDLLRPGAPYTVCPAEATCTIVSNNRRVSVLCCMMLVRNTDSVSFGWRVSGCILKRLMCNVTDCSSLGWRFSGCLT